MLIFGKEFPNYLTFRAESNAIEIFNESGIFQNNNASQNVQVQFEVYVPFGTTTGKYTAHVMNKITMN